MKVKKKLLSNKLLATFGFTLVTLVTIILISILFVKRTTRKTKADDNKTNEKIENDEKRVLSLNEKRIVNSQHSQQVTEIPKKNNVKVVDSEIEKSQIEKPKKVDISKIDPRVLNSEISKPEKPKKILTGILLALENDGGEKGMVVKKWEANEEYDDTIMTGVKLGVNFFYKDQICCRFETPREMLRHIINEVYNDENKTLSELQQKFVKADYQPLNSISLYGVELDPNLRKDLLANPEEINKKLMFYKGGRYKNYVLIDSEADGSCMLHSVATMLTGNNGIKKDYLGREWTNIEDSDRLRSAVIIYVVMHCKNDSNLREVMYITEDDENNLKNVKDFLENTLSILIPDEPGGKNPLRNERVYLSYFFNIIGIILRRSIIWVADMGEKGFVEYVFFANKTIDKDNKPWIFFLDESGHSQTLVPRSIFSFSKKIF